MSFDGQDKADILMPPSAVLSQINLFLWTHGYFKKLYSMSEMSSHNQMAGSLPIYL